MSNRINPPVMSCTLSERSTFLTQFNCPNTVSALPESPSKGTKRITRFRYDNGNNISPFNGEHYPKNGQLLFLGNFFSLERKTIIPEMGKYCSQTRELLSQNEQLFSLDKKFGILILRIGFLILNLPFFLLLDMKQ